MTTLFHNKNIVITGGSMGIGAAAVSAFLEEGATVAILDVKEPGNEIMSQHSGKIHFIRCDVSLNNEVKDAFEQIKSKSGGADVLVNNAGIQTYGTVTSTSEEIWDKTMAVNLKSMFLCSKYCIPLMLERPAPVIVNISSVQGFVCQKEVVAYATSKAAIAGFTRSVAIDYAPKLRCVAVSPAVDTPMLHTDINKLATKEQQDAALKETREIHLLNRIASATEIANFILFLSSEKASFATGQTYRVDGGIGIKIEGT